MLITSNAAAVMLFKGYVHIRRINVAKVQNTVNHRPIQISQYFKIEIVTFILFPH